MMKVGLYDWCLRYLWQRKGNDTLKFAFLLVQFWLSVNWSYIWPPGVKQIIGYPSISTGAILGPHLAPLGPTPNPPRIQPLNMVSPPVRHKFSGSVNFIFCPENSTADHFIDMTGILFKPKQAEANHFKIWSLMSKTVFFCHHVLCYKVNIQYRSTWTFLSCCPSRTVWFQ